MGLLSNFTPQEAIKRFSRLGYYIDHQTGSHIILYNKNPIFPPLTIPNHKELAPGLLRGQIRRAGISVEEFLKLK